MPAFLTAIAEGWAPAFRGNHCNAKGHVAGGREEDTKTSQPEHALPCPVMHKQYPQQSNGHRGKWKTENQGKHMLLSVLSCPWERDGLAKLQKEMQGSSLHLGLAFGRDVTAEGSKHNPTTQAVLSTYKTTNQKKGPTHNVWVCHLL